MTNYNISRFEKEAKSEDKSHLILDLFSGIGGFSLAGKWAGWETIAFCEQDKFCQRVLKKHWPNIPIFTDIRDVTADLIRRTCGRTPTIIVGGVPCQPASVAGRRKGAADDRWLWPDFLRVVRECMPQWVLAENVPGLISLKPHGLDWIVSELEDAGYSAQTIICGANDIGAPHRRDRVWIVAMGNTATQGSSFAGFAGKWQLQAKERAGLDDRLELSGGRGGTLADTCGERLEEHRLTRELPGAQGFWSRSAITGSGDKWQWPARPGEQQYEWEPPRTVAAQSRVGRDANGPARRLDGRNRRERLKALGNGLIPQIPYLIFQAINEIENGTR